MALNFPSNPTLNQVYTGPLGQKWKWNGEAWVSFNEIVSVPTASYLNGFELDLDVPPADGDLLIYNTDTSAWENSKTLSGSYEISGSLTTKGENIVCGSLIITNNSVISGSLVVGNNLTVFGASTLLNLTSSQIDLGTSTLTFNVFSPAVRYGGIAVYDSGSTPSSGSGSLIYDTFSKDWISVDDFGSGITSSVVLLGPQTYNNQGNEIYLSQNTLPKGTGTEHLNDSNITDNGSVVTIDSNTTISGSLTVRENLIVLGSASITYISESTLNIGTNLITVNTINPGARFGGLAVIDSGSSPLVSASFLYDSVQDEFIFVHKGTAGGAITSSHFILGPETYNDQGNEIYLTANRIPKGTGIEHIVDSNISDNGSVVSINSNTQITGSLVVSNGGITGSFSGSGADLFGIPASGIVGLNLSQISSGSYSASISENGLLVNNRVVADSFSGSFSGSGANLFNIPASGIVGLNLSQIASGSVSASISPNSGLQVNTNVTATSFTGSLFGTASWSQNAVTSSYTLDAASQNTNFQQIFLLMGG